MKKERLQQTMRNTKDYETIMNNPVTSTEMEAVI